MVVYNWEVAGLDCIPDDGIFVNIIKTIHWVRKAHFNETTVSCYGSIDIPAPKESNEFIDYNTITKQIIESWLELHIDVLSLDSLLSERVNLANNPLTVARPLPWINQVEENVPSLDSLLLEEQVISNTPPITIVSYPPLPWMNQAEEKYSSP